MCQRFEYRVLFRPVGLLAAKWEPREEVHSSFTAAVGQVRHLRRLYEGAQDYRVQRRPIPEWEDLSRTV